LGGETIYRTRGQRHPWREPSRGNGERGGRCYCRLQICEAIIGEEKEHKHSPDTLSGAAEGTWGKRRTGMGKTTACKSMIAMDRKQRRNDRLRNQCGA